MRNVGTILLAAGLSARMGEQNKLLLPIDGIPVIRHVASVYAAVSDWVFVVTGHQARKVTEALNGLGVNCIFNPDYASGQQSSVAHGLRHSPDVKSLLIGLGDQPLLQVSDLELLLSSHRSNDPEKISIPTLGERRGNPILVPTNLRARLMEDEDRPGCMRFTRENPNLVQRLPLSDRAFYTDVDTPDAYNEVKIIMGERSK